MSHRVVLRRGVLIAVATLVGLLIAQVLPRGSIGAPDSLGTLMGRDLQPPWWEAVTSHTPSPDSASYIVPADLLFSSNSSTIGADGQSVLRALVPQLAGATSITIAGCTDSVGGADSRYNIALSGQRAAAARDVLVRSGLRPDRFHIVAWANTHPVVGVLGLDPATINALNRRIVIMVTRTGQHLAPTPDTAPLDSAITVRRLADGENSTADAVADRNAAQSTRLLGRIDVATTAPERSS